MQRVRSCDFVICLDDPQGQGSAVEREWASAAALPLFNVRLGTVVRPHGEADGFCVGIDIDRASPEWTVSKVLEAVGQYNSRILDYAGYRRAMEVKNCNELAHLRGAWNTLDDTTRHYVAGFSQISEARIEGHLTNGLAWEIASNRERVALKKALEAPPNLQGGFQDLRKIELSLLGRAGMNLGFTHEELLEAVAAASLLLAAPQSRRRRIRTSEDAERILLEARVHMKRER